MRTLEVQVIQSENRWACTRCSLSGRRSKALVEQHIVNVWVSISPPISDLVDVSASSHKITTPLNEDEDLVAMVPPDNASANGIFSFILPNYEASRVSVSRG